MSNTYIGIAYAILIATWMLCKTALAIAEHFKKDTRI